MDPRRGGTDGPSRLSLTFTRELETNTELATTKNSCHHHAEAVPPLLHRRFHHLRQAVQLFLLGCFDIEGHDSHLGHLYAPY